MCTSGSRTRHLLDRGYRHVLELAPEILEVQSFRSWASLDQIQHLAVQIKKTSATTMGQLTHVSLSHFISRGAGKMAQEEPCRGPGFPPSVPSTGIRHCGHTHIHLYKQVSTHKLKGRGCWCEAGYKTTLHHLGRKILDCPCFTWANRQLTWFWTTVRPFAGMKLFPLKFPGSPIPALLIDGLPTEA